MQQYKGYFIKGSALPVHPFSADWRLGGSVLAPGRYSSIVQITRFQLQRLTVDIKELAEWFGWRSPGSSGMNAWYRERTFAVCFNHGISL
jgi:hypothetical protein